MSKFPLFKTAFDLGDIGKSIEQELSKFREQTKGKSFTESLTFLPEFIQKEISGGDSDFDKLKPEEKRKYISKIKSEVQATTPRGGPTTVTRMHGERSGTGEARNFYRAVLAGVGAPASEENLVFMEAWRKAEGGSATFNPFNTTMPAPGATNYNSVGVKNYISKEQGIDATIRTLRKGYYTKIIESLRQRDDASASAAALAASPWGTGALAQKVLSRPGFSPTSIYYLPEDSGTAIV